PPAPRAPHGRRPRPAPRPAPPCRRGTPIPRPPTGARSAVRTGPWWAGRGGPRARRRPRRGAAGAAYPHPAPSACPIDDGTRDVAAGHGPVTTGRALFPTGPAVWWASSVPDRHAVRRTT